MLTKVTFEHEEAENSLGSSGLSNKLKLSQQTQLANICQSLSLLNT